jgi:hypothetical protein
MVPESVRETVREWFGRLHEAKESKGLSTVKDMRGRYLRWVDPVTRADGDRLVSKLDTAVAAFQEHGPGKGRFAPATATNVWGDVQHAFDQAVNAKDPELRVLDTTPPGRRTRSRGRRRSTGSDPLLR